MNSSFQRITLNELNKRSISEPNKNSNMKNERILEEIKLEGKLKR